MNNTGSGIVTSTALVLGILEGFEWYIIGLIIFALAMWVYPSETRLLVKIKKLESDKLELEIELLERQLVKKS